MDEIVKNLEKSLVDHLWSIRYEDLPRQGDSLLQASGHGFPWASPFLAAGPPDAKQWRI